MTFDEKLAQALGDTFDERMEKRLTVTKKHRFSLAYKLWEHKTLKNLRKNRYDKRFTLRRAKFVVFAAILVSLMLLGATSCAVTSVCRYIFVTTKEHKKALWMDIQPSDKPDFEELYVLSEDTGWQIVTFYPKPNELEYIVTFDTVYKCDERKVFLTQEIVTGGYTNDVRAPSSAIKLTDVLGKNNAFFVKRDDVNCFLCWMYDGYFFKLYGDITEDEAIDLARSIKLLEM